MSSEFVKKLTGVRDLKKILETTVKELGDAFGADCCQIMLSNPLDPNVTSICEFRNAPDEEMQGMPSMTLPLVLHGRTFGSFSISRPEEVSQEEVNVMRVILGELGDLIRHAQINDIVQRDTFRDTFLVEIGNLMSYSLGIGDALFMVVNILGKVLQASRCLFICTDDTQLGWKCYEFWQQEKVQSCQDYRWPTTDSPLVAQTLLSESPMKVFEGQRNSYVSPVQEELQFIGVKSLLGIALRSSSATHGCVILQQCDYRRSWTRNEIDMVQNVADKVADALYKLPAEKRAREPIMQLHQRIVAVPEANEPGKASYDSVRKALKGALGQQAIPSARATSAPAPPPAAKKVTPATTPSPSAVPSNQPVVSQPPLPPRPGVQPVAAQNSAPFTNAQPLPNQAQPAPNQGGVSPGGQQSTAAQQQASKNPTIGRLAANIQSGSHPGGQQVRPVPVQPGQSGPTISPVQSRSAGGEAVSSGSKSLGSILNPTNSSAAPAASQAPTIDLTSTPAAGEDPYADLDFGDFGEVPEPSKRTRPVDKRDPDATWANLDAVQPAPGQSLQVQPEVSMTASSSGLSSAASTSASAAAAPAAAAPAAAAPAAAAPAAEPGVASSAAHAAPAATSSAVSAAPSAPIVAPAAAPSGVPIAGSSAGPSAGPSAGSSASAAGSSAALFQAAASSSATVDLSVPGGTSAGVAGAAGSPTAGQTVAGASTSVIREAALAINSSAPPVVPAQPVPSTASNAITGTNMPPAVAAPASSSPVADVSTGLPGQAAAIQSPPEPLRGAEQVEQSGNGESGANVPAEPAPAAIPTPPVSPFASLRRSQDQFETVPPGVAIGQQAFINSQLTSPPPSPPSSLSAVAAPVVESAPAQAGAWGDLDSIQAPTAPPVRSGLGGSMMGKARASAGSSPLLSSLHKDKSRFAASEASTVVMTPLTPMDEAAAEAKLKQLAAEPSSQTSDYIFATSGLDMRMLGRIDSWVNEIEAKDKYKNGHARQVAEYACAIAKEAGLGGSDIETVRQAALVHDLGKLGSSASILQKSDESLSDSELITVMKHPIDGAELLESFPDLVKLSPIVRAHHEEFDGNGYPQGLKGEEIPLAARIVAIANSYHSMVSEKRYGPGMSPGEAQQTLVKGAGKQWDPTFVQALIQAIMAQRISPSM